MTKTDEKKQAQQKLHTADYYNNLEPPVQLGIMVPRCSKIFQSQIAVLNHFIESMFSLGDCPGVFHRDPLFDIYFTVLLIWNRHRLPFLCASNTVLCAMWQHLENSFPSECSIFIPTHKVERNRLNILDTCHVHWELGIKRINICIVLLLHEFGGDIYLFI